MSIIVLNQSYAWFAYDWYSGTMASLIGIIAYGAAEYGFKNKMKLSPRAVILYILLVVSCFFEYSQLSLLFIKAFTFLPLLTFFRIKDDDLRNVLHILTSIFCVLISLSLAIYACTLIGINVPQYNYNNVLYYYFENYYLYIEVSNYIGTFCGFCLEPGYFSFLCVCFLTVNQFNLQDKRCLVFLVAIILSMSLGGYLLCFVGYLMKIILTEGRITKELLRLCGFAIVVSLGLYAAFRFNGGDNMIIERVLNRLMFDKELGIVGNNRENDIAKEILDRFMYSDDIWFGIGSEKLQQIKLGAVGWDACSWRIFVVSHGLLYTLAAFIAIFLSTFNYVEKKVFIMGAVIFLLDFWQHGAMFSESLYMFLILFMSNPRYNENEISV